MKIRISDIKNHITCGLVINNVESLLGLDRPHLFSENKAPDSSWKAFFPADAVLSPLNKHWGDPDRLWLLKFVKIILQITKNQWDKKIREIYNYLNVYDRHTNDVSEVQAAWQVASLKAFIVLSV